MHKLRKFIYQNRYSILATIGIIAFIFIIIQLINFWTKKNNNLDNAIQNTTVVNEDKQGVISNKSAVTGNEVSSTQLENATTTINKFMDYCNKQDFENAYKLITEECKEKMYNNVDVFKNSYYKNVFNGEKKNFTIENWVKDTYKVNITGDALATGKVDAYSRQDYITVKHENGEYKLNINNYIGYTELNKKTTYNNITIEVVGRDTFKEYEEYKMIVTNGTGSTLQLDDVRNTESLYLEDSKGVKYPYYNHELTTPTITVSSEQTKEITIKFYSSYVSTKKIERIVFSNMMLTGGNIGNSFKFNANI